jgi:hypothetical protein
MTLRSRRDRLAADLAGLRGQERALGVRFGADRVRELSRTIAALHVVLVLIDQLAGPAGDPQVTVH